MVAASKPGKTGELGLFLRPRDRHAIPFVIEQSFVRLDQLGQWLAPDFEPAIHEPVLPTKQQHGGLRKQWPRDYRKRLHATRQIVDRWKEKGLVTLVRGWADEPIWLMVTSRGLREFGYLQYKEQPFPELYRLDHYFQINRVRMDLARSSRVPPHTWISERFLSVYQEPAQSGVEPPHRPDGEMALRSGNKVAVEVELGVKSQVEQDKIFHSLLADYSSIWYFCNQTTHETILHRLASYPGEARRRFTVFYLNQSDLTIE